MKNENQENITLSAARLSIAGVIIYQIILAALIFIRPDLDPYWHPISEWAIGSHGWIMVMAFLISALSYSLLIITVWSQIRGVWGKIGLAILIICAIGTFGVGVFVTDPMKIVTGPTNTPITLSVSGTLHIIFGSSALFLLPFAALLINLNLAKKNKAWATAKTSLLWTAALPLFGLICFFIHLNLYVLPLGDYAYGPNVPLGWPPRLLLLTYMIWLITIARQAIRIKTAEKKSIINHFKLAEA
jgi:Protein of unknown function (DUF998)